MGIERVHILVQRLIRGVFNSRPPIPRYVFTWPVGQVLRYFKCLPGNSGLSLKTLSMKTAVLLALVTARRGATLTALNLQFCRILRLNYALSFHT